VPCPSEKPQELVNVRIVDNPHGRTGSFSGRFPQVTVGIWERLEAEQQMFSQVAAWGSERLNLAGGGEARWAETLWVSGGFFDMLRVRACRRAAVFAVGTIGLAALRPASVVSESFWRPRSWAA
jgi:hypothetical protein